MDTQRVLPEEETVRVSAFRAGCNGGLEFIFPKSLLQVIRKQIWDLGHNQHIRELVNSSPVSNNRTFGVIVVGKVIFLWLTRLGTEL